ncbi:EF-hand calcium-binding domain-containing protein 11-like isoform X2 [Physella acuta]|uniref:EF-hand calcium-binding domain-containing protein 11-like isoform X2 n=1 Tax=Physella acuta TaxID=109671 RepID=UPI0027DB7351|nr:EF-hand calcium-binding domain-containing protein 11-like isoform X2 [Physella acuta]
MNKKCLNSINTQNNLAPRHLLLIEKVDLILSPLNVSAFDHSDVEKKGYLVYDDIKVAALMLFGHKLCKAEVQQMLAVHGSEYKTGIKGLSLPQLTAAMTPKFRAEDEDEKIRNTFKAFDKNCQGFLKMEDVKRVFSQVCPLYPEHRVELAFREIDRDGDGRISYKDFDFMMKFNNLL